MSPPTVSCFGLREKQQPRSQTSSFVPFLSFTSIQHKLTTISESLNTDNTDKRLLLKFFLSDHANTFVHTHKLIQVLHRFYGSPRFQRRITRRPRLHRAVPYGYVTHIMIHSTPLSTFFTHGPVFITYWQLWLLWWQLLRGCRCLAQGNTA